MAELRSFFARNLHSPARPMMEGAPLMATSAGQPFPAPPSCRQASSLSSEQSSRDANSLHRQAMSDGTGRAPLIAAVYLKGAKVFRSVACVVFLFAAATFSVACDESMAAPSPTSQSAAAASVTEGVWKLQSFQRVDSTIVPVPDPDRFTIEIAPDGRLAVRADCNRCSASYSQSSGALRVGPAMACTKAFCSTTAPFDEQYTAALSDATLVRATATSLEFVSSAGVLKFAR